MLSISSTCCNECYDGRFKQVQVTEVRDLVESGAVFLMYVRKMNLQMVILKVQKHSVKPVP